MVFSEGTFRLKKREGYDMFRLEIKIVEAIDSRASKRVLPLQ